MKEKTTLKIIITIIVTLIFLGIFYYSENIVEIPLIKNIKIAINKQNEKNKINEITTIDVTYLEENRKFRT